MAIASLASFASSRWLVFASCGLVICGAGAAACGDDGSAPIDGVDGGTDAPPVIVPPNDAEIPDAPIDQDAGPPPAEKHTRFVLLGDFGFDDNNELAVANLVKTWKPEFIVTLGDNSYPEGNPLTIDDTIGKYYGEFIYPYKGDYGPGATEQRFYACLGNHDWASGSLSQHYDYFQLPNNERYWTIQKGPVRVLCVDSDEHEPDGNTADSVQGKWLQKELLAAKDPYRLVVFHHPSHSSGEHGSQTNMQWPFQVWGASAVYTGHDHDYERFDFGLGTIPYVVQGTGGADLRPMSTSRTGSVIAYSEKHGATLVDATDSYADFQAITVGRDLIDEHVVTSTFEAQRSSEVLFAPGSSFRYLDNAAAPAGWMNPSFDVAAWKTGTAPLGYGQGGEATVIAQRTSHYFRGTFDVKNPSEFHHLVVWAMRDDGAAIYVNGQEVSRSNLGAGPLTDTTLATYITGFTAEKAWVPTVVPMHLVRAGANVVAVELHQSSATSSDATLDLRVEGKR